MEKRKIQSGKSVDQKLDAITSALEKMATKDDLKSFATKDDLKKAVAGMVTNERFETVMRLFRDDFNDLKDYVHGKLVTKKEFFDRLHEFQDSLSEIRDYREKRLLFEGQHVDLQDRVAKHEKRIVMLENKIA